uniref:Transporter n=1 Tax=Rhabditophanes sp. KR3021 TaxID=114890 RepID=A0AC35UFN0_9BILA
MFNIEKYHKTQVQKYVEHDGEFSDMTNISVNDEESAKKRGQWGSRLQFILTCVGLAVGLGNLWRFNYVLYENGGSAFLIPYIIASMVIGLPMLCFELNFGQFTGSTPAIGQGKLMPAAQGVGWAMAINSAFIGIYYNMVLAWIVIYIFMIVTQQGHKYTSCSNAWNTEFCVSHVENTRCAGNVTAGEVAAFFNKACHYAPNMEAMMQMETNFFANQKKISATEEFYDRFVLERGPSFEDWGQLNWKLLSALTFCWLLIFVVLWKGIKLLGKISLVTSTLPYFVIIAFFFKVRGLDGASEGLDFFLFKPDFSYLLKSSTWLTAATQLCFSFSLGQGAVQSLASYNAKNHNVMTDVLIIGSADMFMSLVGGSVVFQILGFLAKQTGRQVKDVVSSGTALAFVTYPEATSMMAGGQIWALAYFMMLFFLGLGTEICYIEVMVTSFYDNFKSTRPYKIYLSAIICFLFWCCGIPLCFSNGPYIFTILNDFTSSFNLLCVIFLELIIVVLYYGVGNFINDIRCMIGPPTSKLAALIGPTGAFIKYTWMIITPISLLILTGASLLQIMEVKLTYGTGDTTVTLPQIATYIGWFVCLSPFLAIPIFLLVNVVNLKKKGKSLKKLFHPTSSWPTVIRVRKQIEDNQHNDFQGIAGFDAAPMRRSASGEIPTNKLDSALNQSKSSLASKTPTTTSKSTKLTTSTKSLDTKKTAPAKSNTSAK